MQIKEKKSSPPTIYFNIWQTKYIFDLHPYRKLRIFAKNKQHHDKKTINCFHIVNKYYKSNKHRVRILNKFLA